ncbi:MAG: MFS transporter [Bacteroidetes bacterium]|nr:MFS transporter [Bacteroidota bacterium]
MKKPAIWIIFLTIFIDILGFGLVIPILPNFVCQTLGFPEIVSGLMMGIFSLMQFLFSTFWGTISDKYGRKPILLASSFITAVSYLLFAFTNNLWMLIVSRVLAGFGSANIAAATAYIADISKPEDRTKSMGKLGAAFGMGFIFGPPLGGFLTHKFNSIFPVGIVAMAICLVNFLLIYFILPESIKEKGKSSRPGFIKSNIDAIKELKKPFVGTILIFYFLFIAAFSMMQVSSILLWENEYGVSKKGVGWIFAFIGLVSSLVQGGLLGKITNRFSDKTLLYTGWILMAIGLGSLPFLPKTFFWFFALTTCAMIAFANACISPVFMSIISKKTDPLNNGKIMGILQSYGALARIVGPVIGGGLYQIIYQLPLATGSAIMILSVFGLKNIFKPVKNNI